METDDRLPSRATEQGIELISLDDGLDLIRQWLPDAPNSVRITRIRHELCEDGHEFTISCHYPPVDDCHFDSHQELTQAFDIWLQHVAELELPTQIYIGSEDISLDWYPKSVTPREAVEFSTQEQAEADFLHLAEQAICIWQLLRGQDSQTLHATFGGFEEAFTNMVDPPELASAYGHVFTQETLEDSVLSQPSDWLYLLALAKASGVQTTLTRDFAAEFLRLQSTPFPDISDLAAVIHPFVFEYPEEPLTPDQKHRASKIFTIATEFLDQLLCPRPNEVNHFFRTFELLDPRHQ